MVFKWVFWQLIKLHNEFISSFKQLVNEVIIVEDINALVIVRFGELICFVRRNY